MELKIFDSHAHLTSDSVYSDIDGVVSRAKSGGVHRIMNICTDKQTLQRGIELSKRYPWIFNAGATTPHDVEKEGELFFPEFAQAAKEGHLVAIGETGLDYFYEHSDKALQQQYLMRYLHLATECNLPVIFHCRDAFDDLYAITDQEFSGKAVLHCFTGAMHDAERALERGWYISMSGILTFKKSEELREVAKEIPTDRLLIETDTPYLAPQSKRGKQNEPAFVTETAQKLAEIKNVSLEEIASQTFQNASDFFL